MNEQIKDMAKLMCEDCAASGEHCPADLCAGVVQQAQVLYNAGYRKQSEGEWIFEHEFYGKMLCSNCKEEALTNEDNEYVDSDFCPNCGAKMKGGES